MFKDTPINLRKVLHIENEDSTSRERKSTFKIKKANVPQIGTRRPLIIKNNFVTNSESSQNINGLIQESERILHRTPKVANLQLKQLSKQDEDINKPKKKLDSARHSRIQQIKDQRN